MNKMSCRGASVAHGCTKVIQSNPLWAAVILGQGGEYRIYTCTTCTSPPMSCLKLGCMFEMGKLISMLE